MQLLWYGLVPYEEGIKIQLNFVDKVRDGLLAPGMVIALEHEAVITLGKRGAPAQDLLWNPKEISNAGIRVCTTDRGGQATLHNPGQLVLYPIIDLRALNLSVREYVEVLENATIDFLAKNGFKAERRGAEPGLWVGVCKIAAFGVRVDRGVTMHGVAINVKNDLSQFRAIRVCGQRAQVSSMAEERGSEQALDLPTLAAQWMESFEALISSKTSKSHARLETRSEELR